MAKARKRARDKTPRAVVVAAFADLPIWEATLDAFDVPHALARRGFYCKLSAHASDLFERHPERAKLPAKAVDAAIELVEAVVKGTRWHLTESLGRYDVDDVQFDIGFHADLDAAELTAAFEKDGFQIFGLEALGDGVLASTAARMGTATWPFVTVLLERGIAIGPVIEAIVSLDPPRPPAKLFDRIAAALAPSELPAYRALLENFDEDLVVRALPVIERLCGTKRTKRRVSGLPTRLATLLSAFDGIPALGVISAAEIAKTATAQSKATRQPWQFLSERVRGDRAWRPEWTPFATADGRLICIDDAPSTNGRRGQIISVSRTPPELRDEGRSLDDWLWTKLAAITPPAEAARPARARSQTKASRATARAR